MVVEVGVNFIECTHLTHVFVCKISVIPTISLYPHHKFISPPKSPLLNRNDCKFFLKVVQEIIRGGYRVYSLNASQTKKVIIGLEFDNGAQQFVPKLRLLGHDRQGIVFTHNSWEHFKSR